LTTNGETEAWHVGYRLFIIIKARNEETGWLGEEPIKSLLEKLRLSLGPRGQSWNEGYKC
jgi:hypothetical protein